MTLGSDNGLASAESRPNPEGSQRCEGVIFGKIGRTVGRVDDILR
jgi:hypothetical protein